MRAAVAMRADVDDERAGRDIDLVRTEENEQVDGALSHFGGALAARARHEAEIECCDARRGRVQNGKAVPAVSDETQLARGLPGKRGERRAILTRERSGTDDHQRMLCGLECLAELRLSETAERLCARAEIVVIVREVCLLADHADREIAPAPAL